MKALFAQAIALPCAPYALGLCVGLLAALQRCAP